LLSAVGLVGTTLADRGGGIVYFEAVLLDGAERDGKWERLCAISPSYRSYEAMTAKGIPVIHLRRAA
jgi:hypothetical protein